MRVGWDEEKNRANQTRHGISFDEAAELLQSDVDYLEVFDEPHSDDEDRFIAVGPIRGGVIVVVYTEPDELSLRIISARRATVAERRRYEEHAETRGR